MESTRRRSDAAIAKARVEGALARRLQARAELSQHAKARAWASPRGAGDQRFNLRPLRVEPLVAAKTELAGAATERVDTRVLRMLYEVDAAGAAASAAFASCVGGF